MTQLAPQPRIADDSAELVQLLRDSVDAFVRDHGQRPLSRAFRGRSPGYDPALLQEMSALGWTGLLVPEADGGSGLGFSAMGAVLEGLSGSLLAEPLTATSVLAGRTLERLPASPVRDDLLTLSALGEARVALGWQDQAGDLEPSANGLDLVPGPEGFILSGRRRFVAGAAAATHVLLIARGPEGLALVAVPADTPGVTVTLDWRADGAPAATLQLEGVAVAGEQVLGAGDGVAKALDAALDEARAMACAELVGLIRAVMTMTIEYLCVREQYGRLIGSFQALQHKAVDLLVQQELATAVLEETVTALDAGVEGDERARLVSRCKARCSDAALRIAREAIQLHGAIGYTEEHDLGLYMKRALVLAAWLGNGAQHRRRYSLLSHPI